MMLDKRKRRVRELAGMGIDELAELWHTRSLALRPDRRDREQVGWEFPGYFEAALIHALGRYLYDTEGGARPFELACGLLGGTAEPDRYEDGVQVREVGT